MRRKLARTMGRAALLLLLTAPAWPAEEAEFEELAWLSGCWQETGSEPGTGEHWTTSAGGIMLGTSRTIQTGKLVAFEFMQIRVLEDGRLAFIAQPSGNPPTTFIVKSLSGARAVFENLKHDFPQRVIYARTPEGDLHAQVEGLVDGKERSVDFPMRRVDCTAHFAAQE